MSETALLGMMEWLADATIRGASLEDLLSGVCRRLVAAQVPLARTHVSASTLHPVIGAEGVTWTPAKGAVRAEYGYAGAESAVWLDSPFHHMLVNGLVTLRHQFGQLPDEPFPVFAEFRQDGMTDWICHRHTFEWDAPNLPYGTLGMFASWATRDPAGFTDGQEALLRRLSGPLAAAVRGHVIEDLAHNVLGAYLGIGAAEQVLSGAITRGHVSELPAVILLADIRGFTERSTIAPIGELVALINHTFEVAAGPIAAAQGQILKFMGDGFLAVFLTAERDRVEAVGAALDAALAIQAVLPEDVELDIALHIGDVHYGNIGAADRLDFTIIGAAVNEASRLENLCSVLGRTILVSEAAAECLPPGRVVSLGRHRLRGFAEPRELFAPVGP